MALAAVKVLYCLETTPLPQPLRSIKNTPLSILTRALSPEYEELKNINEPDSLSAGMVIAFLFDTFMLFSLVDELSIQESSLLGQALFLIGYSVHIYVALTKT